MTTIAYRDGVMVSDGRMVFDNTIMSDSTVKIFRLSDGALMAITGEASYAQAIINALETEDEELPQAPGDVNAILVEVGGTIKLFDGIGEFEVVETNYIALGSGAAFAYGALDSGCTAEEAVKAAIKRDPQSGGRIQVLELQEETEWHQ